MRLTTSGLARRLSEAWSLTAPSIVPHDAGMNSRTWFVTEGGDRYVAKAVPDAARQRFLSGLAVASLVNVAGIPAGVPIPTREGRAYVELVGHTVALLEFVKGKPLLGENEGEQQTIGGTL
ncbi:MAG: phosphotransferase, partial [Chloroflexi bacterium]|nr:phosphotransferase [Chloroflexota bacterium]